MGQAGGRVGGHVSGVFLAGLSAGAVLRADNDQAVVEFKDVVQSVFSVGCVTSVPHRQH